MPQNVGIFCILEINTQPIQGSHFENRRVQILLALSCNIIEIGKTFDWSVSLVLWSSHVFSSFLPNEKTTCLLHILAVIVSLVAHNSIKAVYKPGKGEHEVLPLTILQIIMLVFQIWFWMTHFESQVEYLQRQAVQRFNKYPLTSPWYLNESYTLRRKSQNGQRYSNLNSKTKSASSTNAHTTRNFRYRKVLQRWRYYRMQIHTG